MGSTDLFKMGLSVLMILIVSILLYTMAIPNVVFRDPGTGAILTLSRALLASHILLGCIT